MLQFAIFQEEWERRKSFGFKRGAVRSPHRFGEGAELPQGRGLDTGGEAAQGRGRVETGHTQQNLQKPFVCIKDLKMANFFQRQGSSNARGCPVGDHYLPPQGQKGA